MEDINEQIIELRKRKLPNKSIASQLKITSQKLQRLLRKLIKAGSIKRKKVFAKDRGLCNNIKFVDFIKYYSLGMTYKEIGEQLGYRKSVVATYAAKLLREGTIKNRKRGKRKKTPTV